MVRVAYSEGLLQHRRPYFLEREGRLRVVLEMMQKFKMHDIDRRVWPPCWRKVRSDMRWRRRYRGLMGFKADACLSAFHAVGA